MNIALIGLGMVAGMHVTAIKASDAGLTLKGVLGRGPARTAAFATDHGVAAYSDVDEIAADPEIDFVILATPPDARAEIVKTLAAAGKPILMEKPIERDLSAAISLIETCEAAGVPLGIVFQHRAREASIALKDAIDAGRLGQIATVDLRIPWWRDQSYYDVPGRGTYGRDGGGVMISQAIHTLDLAIWLLGPVASIQAIMHRTHLHDLEAEDWAGALLELESGAVGTLMATTTAYPGAAETIEIQGTKAHALLGSGVLTLTHLDGTVETFGATGTTGGGADPMAFTHDWHQTVIEDFARALSAGTPPMIPAREALRTHAVIEAMQTASRTGSRTKVPT
jgi:predicted dehydrogenase